MEQTLPLEIRVNTGLIYVCGFSQAIYLSAHITISKSKVLFLKRFDSFGGKKIRIWAGK